MIYYFERFKKFITLTVCITFRVLITFSTDTISRLSDIRPEPLFSREMAERKKKNIPRFQSEKNLTPQPNG